MTKFIIIQGDNKMNDSIRSRKDMTYNGMNKFVEMTVGEMHCKMVKEYTVTLRS